MNDRRYFAPISAQAKDDEGNTYLAFLEVPAPDGLRTVEKETPLIPLFTSATAARRVGVDVERCVRPCPSELAEMLGLDRPVVVDPGGSPMVVTRLGALMEDA